jgi:D-galactarolactone isomerase
MNDKPCLNAPAGACDCHMHIYDRRYKPAPTSPFPPPAAPVDAYRIVQRQLGLTRAVVVQPNAYAFDNSCTEEAIVTLGANARGVATIRPDTADAEIERLSRGGIRGARCFMLKGGLLSWDDVDAIAARVAPFGWHVQIQLDGRDLPLHSTRIARLPTETVIDHNGKFLDPVAPAHPSFRALLALLDGGRCWVKLSAPYETSKSGPPCYDDVSVLARALTATHPERCVWATNWPHPNASPPPSNSGMLDLLLDWVPDEAMRCRILVDNPARLYGF